eukprot:4163592-Pyramimonas_sp.AAC.1
MSLGTRLKVKNISVIFKACCTVHEGAEGVRRGCGRGAEWARRHIAPFNGPAEAGEHAGDLGVVHPPLQAKHQRLIRLL